MKSVCLCFRYFIKSCAICLLFLVCLVNDCHCFCRPFNKTSGLTELCGYSATANFTHDKHYDVAVRSMFSISKLLSSCADQAASIVCSAFVPRCEKDIPGPFLPCRRVCDDFNNKCRDRIVRYGMEWIIGMCQLLPVKDDPNTKLGYLGRCFEPPNFNSSVQKSKLNTKNW